MGEVIPLFRDAQVLQFPGRPELAPHPPICGDSKPEWPKDLIANLDDSIHNGELTEDEACAILDAYLQDGSRRDIANIGQVVLSLPDPNQLPLF